MNSYSYLAGLARISLQAGVLVLLVLLVQWLFRKQLPPRWRCALWFLVIARLVLPISPGSATSIYNLVPQWKSHPSSLAPAAPTARTAPAAPASTSLAAPPPVLSRAPDSPNAHGPIVADNRVEPEPAPLSQRHPARASPMKNAPATQAPVTSSWPAISWSAILFWVWLTGVLLLGGCIAFCSLRFARQCRGLRALTDAAVLAIRDDCARRLGLRRQVVIVESGQVANPALFGMFRPRLMLPKDFVRNFSEQELRFVLLHELAHLRRQDLLLNWLVTLLQVLHWFNPLLWLGFSRWRVDRELACDALALEAAGGAQNREYGQTILRLLESFTQRSPAPGLVGILEDRRQLHQRIRMIASFRPGKRRGLLAAGLLATLTIIGLTDAQTPKSPTGQKPQKAAVTTAAAALENSPAAKQEERVGEDPSTEKALRSVAVTVVDPTEKPLPGAEVFVPYMGGRNEPHPRRLTDAQGRFLVRIPYVPKEFRGRMSNFSLSAKHQDYAQRAVMWTASSGDVYAGLPEQVTIRLERGVVIGGRVKDEQGAPLAGVRVLLTASGYKGFSLGTDERQTHEYSEVSINDPSLPAATTDASGHWSFPVFPADLDNTEVTLVRPDGAREPFSSNRSNHRPLVPFAELRAQTWVAQLGEGLNVRGVVLDETGQPLAGVSVKEGYGNGNIVRVSEFTTDARGRFERTHRVPRQWIYTASRADRATASVVAQVQAGMPEVRIVLPPAKPWRVRVTDENDTPLADAELAIDTFRTEAQILDWSGKADANGRVVWTNAPLSNVVVYANAKALGATRKVRITGGGEETHLVLKKSAQEKIAVQVKAVDLQTRQPVKVESAMTLFETMRGGFKPLANPGASDFVVEIALRDFQVGMYPSYALKLEAAGYEDLVTDRIDYDYGDQNLELAMSRSVGSGEVTVLQPDGAPAAGAQMWAQATPEGGGHLSLNAPGKFYSHGLTKGQANEQGRLKVSFVQGKMPVVISHSSGFLETTASEIRRQVEVRLQPYGVVEGRLLVAGKPKSGVQLSLGILAGRSGRGVVGQEERINFFLSYTAATAADGRFAFKEVPAGDYKLYRWALPPKQQPGGGITETYQTPVTVLAGKTSSVEYATSGRVVVGRAIPEAAGVAADWRTDVHTLSLKLPGTPLTPRANREDYATLAAYIKANNQSLQSETQWQNARQARTYALSFEEDGSFRADDVPPGTYELRIHLTKPSENGRPPFFNNPIELGSLTREVVVPAGQETLDLGTLAVTMGQLASTAVTPPFAFSATTLEGKPLTLAELKGKNVLLVFWASWSERSLEGLAELQKLQSQFAADARLTFVGANLDDSIESARKIVSQHGYSWPQTWLDPAGRAKLTAAFEVNSLPAIFLLDEEGRIVAKELEGERLPLTLKRTLARR